MKKLKWFFFILVFCTVFLGLNLVFRIDFLIRKIQDGSFGLPVIRISLNDTSLETIRNNSKDIKYEGNELELIDGETTRYFSDVQIKGRGNSTWVKPKLPFQIKFKDKEDLLGLGPRKKYILLANYVDDSNLRNAIMFKLADMLDEKFRVSGEFVELYIDNDYQGLYYLTTKVEVGKNSVDLRNEYGVLMELDTLHKEVEICHFSSFNECIIAKDAVFYDDNEKLNLAVSDFLDDYNKLEAAAKEGDFELVSELIDLPSFAEYFLVSEFAVNPDAFVSSFNYYKDGQDDKIHAGPLWDYDYAFGNRNWIWGDDEKVFSPNETMIHRLNNKPDSDVGKLMYYLIDIPEFRAEVERIFQEKLSGKSEELLSWLKDEFKKIRKAALRDMTKWEEDEWRSPSEIIDDETKYLLDWLEKRYEYFEEEYGKKEWIFTPGVI